MPSSKCGLLVFGMLLRLPVWIDSSFCAEVKPGALRAKTMDNLPKYVDYSEKTGEPYIRLGDNILRLEREEISGQYVEKARRELRETPENVEKALHEFRLLIEAEKDFYFPVDDDAFLLKFIRPCKFYPCSAFQRMKKFYQFQEKYPKFYSHLTPKSVKRIYISGVVTFLPCRTPEGSRIMVFTFENWNTKESSIVELIRGFLIAVEIAMGEPKTQVGGVHVVMNFEGFSLDHVMQFTPGIAKIIIYLVQECFPLRIKGVHVINQMAIFKIVYAVFKPFLGQKFRNRLHFHGTNFDSLKRHIAEESLPPKWGGTLNSPDCPGEALYEDLAYYEEEYEELNSFGYKKEKVIR